MLKIDAHHHFRRYSTEAYPWMKSGTGMDAIQRDFLPDDAAGQTIARLRADLRKPW